VVFPVSVVIMPFSFVVAVAALAEGNANEVSIIIKTKAIEAVATKIFLLIE
jgi:hypothetical protein